MTYRGVRKELIIRADLLACTFVDPSDVNPRKQIKLMGVPIQAPEVIVRAIIDDFANLAVKRAIETKGFDPVLTQRATTTDWRPNIRIDLLAALNKRATDPRRHILKPIDTVTRDFQYNLELVGIIRELNGDLDKGSLDKIECEINECINKKYV
jgi:hypothetical protein